MKKSLFILIAFIVAAVVFTGCQTAKPAPIAEIEDAPEEIPFEHFIWKMLREGDDNARGYFHGEFDADIKDAEGRTPLHYAVARQDASLARFFLALGANPDALDNYNQSPLGIAIENSDHACIQLLAGSHADIFLTITNGSDAVSLALSKGAAVFNSIITPASINQTDSDGNNLLHISAITGNVEAIEKILNITSALSYINLLNKSEKNALDYALERPDSLFHIQAAEKLILAGAYSNNEIYSYFSPAVLSGNYNIRRNEGLAPIHYAVIGNHGGLIDFLLEKDIDVNLKSASGASPLHEASRNGNVNVIELLIEKGADVNSQDAKGNTPLHTGIPLEKHLETALLLLENGANPNIRDEHGETPLHIAITLDRPLEVIQALLSGGSDVHSRNIQGQTPLYIAVNEKRVNLIPVLLAYGSEVFASDNSNITPFDLAFKLNGNMFELLVTSETVNQRDTAGNTMLHATVRNRGTPDQIAMILTHRPIVDATNRAGDTALHIAVRTNQNISGEFLLSRGANIFSNNARGESPLYLALSSSPIRGWIINSVTINAKDGIGNNMLHYASQWNLNNAIPLIIRGGLSVESANATGETPLFMAVKSDSTSTIRVLAENNANINARDFQGNSLLHAAVRWNAKNSASLLISSGMDVNVFSLNGNTPLHDAVILGMSDIETLLLNEKANLEVRNIEGNTPLMEAVRAGFIPSLEKLAGAGADTSPRNIRGETPLHFAVRAGNLDLVRVLLRMGSSIHARNTQDITPFRIALGVSDQMVRLLLTGNRINQSDDMGNSPLHIAVLENASNNIIRSIISTGGRINAIDSNGKTPVRIAVDMELWDTVKILSEAGADPFIAAVDNRYPAEIAFEKGEDCIRSIFFGSAINLRDSKDNTILHIAARHSTPELIGVLLELGANKRARNISLELPYEIAERWNRYDNAELLRN